MTTTTEMPEPSDCPKCDAKIELATGANGSTPSPGDVSVCWMCGEVLQFDDDLKMIRCDDKAIRNAPQITQLRTAVLTRPKSQR